MRKLNILLAIALAALFGVSAIYSERKEKLKNHTITVLASEGIYTGRIKIVRFLENDIYTAKYNDKCIATIKWSAVESKLLNDTCGE